MKKASEPGPSTNVHSHLEPLTDEQAFELVNDLDSDGFQCDELIELKGENEEITPPVYQRSLKFNREEYKKGHMNPL